MNDALAIFRFLRDCTGRGERAVLVTLTEVTGSAARAVGAHMAVAESGASIGSFSGGCVEAAVIAEAQEVLACGRARRVRYGAGSPYIDIRLPCGGGIDLLFAPVQDTVQLTRAFDLLEQRRPVMLNLSEEGTVAAYEALGTDVTSGWIGHSFLVRHDPPLRLVVMGHGAEPMALLKIASAYGADTFLLSPDSTLIEHARRSGYTADLLRLLGRSDRLSVDPWTAVVALFHDHDWEVDLLLQALEQNPFFVGAMGSRKTHAERRQRLLAVCDSPLRIDQIIGPIGLIDASRDPPTLAISIMAQVVQAYEGLVDVAPKTAPSASTMNGTHRPNE